MGLGRWLADAVESRLGSDPAETGTAERQYMRTTTAPCGQTLVAPNPWALGVTYSAHVSSCVDARCRAASGRTR